MRHQTERLVEPLSEADAQLQSMPDASPAKWHLAHTTWFFETFILQSYCDGYRPFDPSYNYLFNSYYNGIGKQYPRPQRGLISRPSLSEIIDYRHMISNRVCELLCHSIQTDLIGLIELGIQHEQQHQELLLTDIKHAFFHNPTYPAYQSLSDSPSLLTKNTNHQWLEMTGGMFTIGANKQSFSFDNERPQHSVYLHPYFLSRTLVSNGDYLRFIEDGGYQRTELWLADGWAWLQKNRARMQGVSEHPLYWIKQEGQWFEFSLHGLLPLNESQTLIHISYYEASAYAAWASARLPTEFEWEAAVAAQQVIPLCESICLSPSITSTTNSDNAFGQAWQWTSSSYSPYPGFTPFTGVAGEYNGKFMSNQMVLRGSSCVTPVAHARLSYRNFFYAPQMWQFTGIRLAKDAI